METIVAPDWILLCLNISQARINLCTGSQTQATITNCFLADQQSLPEIRQAYKQRKQSKQSKQETLKQKPENETQHPCLVLFSYFRHDQRAPFDSLGKCL